MERLTIEIICAILAVIVGGGAFLAIKINKSKSRKTDSSQKDINITGNGNKVVGGDDNSISIK